MGWKDPERAREYMREWHRNNPRERTERQKEQSREASRRRYTRLRADPESWQAERQRMQAYCDRKRRFLRAVKDMLGCCDCGTTSERLDFDHRPDKEKKFNLARPRCSWENLLAELEKCDVRCASCHARRHGIERGGLNEPAALSV